MSKEWATSWIEYHAALGFTRLFIFWDDPDFDRQTIDYLANDPVYSWVVDSYEPDEDYKSKFFVFTKLLEALQQLKKKQAF